MTKRVIISGIVILIFSSFLYLFSQNAKEIFLSKTIENLNGAYGGDEESENAYFAIYTDSVYYPDSDNWVKLKLNHDTIFLTDNKECVEKLLIRKLTKDSLILYNLNYETEYRLRRRGKE